MRLERVADTAPEMEQWAVDALRDLTARIRRLASAQKLLGLTDREMQVMMLVIDGWDSEQIGTILGISFKTTVFHRGTARKRMGTKNGIQAAIKLDRAIQATQS